MSVSDFLIVFGACALTMLACRVLPVFLLKGKQLPETVVRALNFIPPAAFAALVANDLFDPVKIASGDTWSWLAPLIAAVAVMVVGIKTKSLAWCILVGVCFLAVLMYGPALLG
ncbi:MAG: AzlD domain-containing protein [Slackia sp.]|nr:AzlD domain-containing protein [Slackia sp.]